MTYNSTGITLNDQLNRIAVSFDSFFKQQTQPTIEKVIFNYPATIVIWSDKTKTVVRCQNEDDWDPEKGLAMAISKKFFGNKGNYCNVFKKWIPEEDEKDFIATMEEVSTTFSKALRAIFGGHDE